MLLRRSVAVLGLAMLCIGPAMAADPLILEAKIPLGEVAGRIDHMAVDVKRKRLFVAELGNDTLGVVDLTAGKVIHRITGLKEPQGVAYIDGPDLVYTANARDGSVRIFRAGDFSPVGGVKLDDDADNIRLDRAAGQVIIGHGDGGLAFLEAATGRVVFDVKLPAHPESFRLAPDGKRIYVNLPDARQIAVIDRTAGRTTGKWGIDAAGNFPMALNAVGTRLAVVYRTPPLLAIFDAATGAVLARLPICGDSDDVFFDDRRRRLYVSCGAGDVAVIREEGGSYAEATRIRTNSGARTSLFVPELDRLFVAVRARNREPAAIWVFRPED